MTENTGVEIAVKVRLDSRDVKGTLETYIRRVEFDKSRHTFFRKTCLSRDGEWLPVAEGAAYPEACNLRTELCDLSDPKYITWGEIDDTTEAE